VNLCADTGARDAVFGGGDAGLGFGTAEEVACAEYRGTRATEDGIIGAATNQGSLGRSEGHGIGVSWSIGVLFMSMSFWLNMMRR